MENQPDVHFVEISHRSIHGGFSNKKKCTEKVVEGRDFSAKKNGVP